MLSTDKILKNTTKYFETATANNSMNEQLMEFLGEDFIKAPASTLKSLHNAFEGGLIFHLLTTTKYAVIFNDALPKEDQVDKTSLIKVCLLHQIGKFDMYKLCESDWHIKNQGKMYDFKNESTSMRVGEKSLYIAMQHGIKFTPDEAAAILNYDKTDDKMATYHNTMLGDLLKTANLFAIKNEQKNG